MSGKDMNKGAVGVNPAVAAVTGAIVGGVAVAGAMVLGNEENRKKINETLSDVKDKSVDYVEDVKQAAEDKKQEVLDKAESIKNVLTEE